MPPICSIGLISTKKTQNLLSKFGNFKIIYYLCTAFSVREAGEIPAQSRCCDSQSDVQILISHWFLANWEGWTKER